MGASIADDAALNAGEDADMLAVRDWLPRRVLDEPPALPRGVVGVGRLDELPPVAPTLVASTPVTPEPVSDEPEFEPVIVGKVLAPVIEALALDSVAIELSAPEAPEVDRVVLDPSVVDLLESSVAVVGCVGDVAVVSLVAASEVLVAVL